MIDNIDTTTPEEALEAECENNDTSGNDIELQNDGETNGKSKVLNFLKTCGIPFFISLLFTMALGLCFRVIKVQGESMLDTYKDGNIVIANHIGYILSGEKVDRGDVVVIKESETVPFKIIKRVIGVGGDTIDINFETGEVLLNGEILDEPYIKEPTHYNGKAFEYPVTIPDDCYFVMGDNRNASMDSRSIDVGFVNKHNILGKVM